jgi:hypothetical protein
VLPCETMDCRVIHRLQLENGVVRLGKSEICRSKAHINKVKATRARIFGEKTDFLDIWGCGFCWVTLEPPLPERQTQSDGAPDGRGGTRVDLETGR